MVEGINRRESHIGDVPSEALAHLPMYSRPLSSYVLREAGCVVVTDHSAVDYIQVATEIRVVVDTRG